MVCGTFGIIKRLLSKIKKAFRKDKKVKITPYTKAEENSKVSVWSPASTCSSSYAYCSRLPQLIAIFSPYEQLCMLFQVPSFEWKKQPRENVVFEIDTSKTDCRKKTRNQFLDLQLYTDDWCLDKLFETQQTTVAPKKQTPRVKRSRANRRKTLVAPPDLSCLNGGEMDD